MSGLYRELAERFHGEVVDLDRVVQRALRAWKQAKAAASDRDLYLDSVALNLHSFYSGLERPLALRDGPMAREALALGKYLHYNVPPDGVSSALCGKITHRGARRAHREKYKI